MCVFSIQICEYVLCVDFLSGRLHALKTLSVCTVKELYDRFYKNTFELVHLPLQLQLTHLRCILLNTKASHYVFLAKEPVNILLP